jgi:hypothetical protein
VLVPIEDDDLVLRPPPPPERVADVGAAVREALRFPLSGLPLAALTPRGGRATIVVGGPLLPLPSSSLDPRREALAATMEEIERCGIPDERQTILVATGLGRRYGQRELERLLPPPKARSFRGRVVVHDAEDSAQVEIVEVADHPVRIQRALVDTDLVVVLSAAETVLHGGPGTLVAACDALTVRSVGTADSLLEAPGTPDWDLALGVESALARRTALVGVSLVLDLPRFTGVLRGYPYDDEAVEQLARSPLRKPLSLLPAPARRGILARQGSSTTATAAFAGAPSVAHAEALLHGIALRGTSLAEPLDVLVVGVPWIGPGIPRETINPVTAASMVLGLALRLHRDAFPIRPDGTVVMVHSLRRSFGHGTQAPYAAMFQALRSGAAVSGELAAVDAYRKGRACHPLLPYAEWAGCGPALARLGRVIVAECRDAGAARALGFVPTRGIASALEMAHGVSGVHARVGVLLAPPYPSLLVG